MNDYSINIKNTFSNGSIRDAKILFEACIHNAFPTFNFRGLELIRFLQKDQYMEGISSGQAGIFGLCFAWICPI